MKAASLGFAVVLTLAVTPWCGGAVPVNAADQPDCPTGDEWLACRAQAGDPGAMYAVGRDAYDAARASGDFSQALDWARKLVALHDKNGERLLKMTYMQLGWGAHHDYVQAYVWLSEGIAGGEDYLVKWRNTLAAKMTPEQLSQAKSQVKE